MSIKTGLFSALCAVALANGATAQETAPVDPATIDLGQRMSMAYSTFARDLFTDLLGPKEILKLFVLTKQEVVSMMCEGYTLDLEKHNTALNDVVNTQPMTDGQYDVLIFGRIAHAYGTFRGGEIALATFDPVAYCAYGDQVIAEAANGDPEGILVLSASE
jgi:hypothetical protein